MLTYGKPRRKSSSITNVQRSQWREGFWRSFGRLLRFPVGLEALTHWLVINTPLPDMEARCFREPMNSLVQFWQAGTLEPVGSLVPEETHWEHWLPLWRQTSLLPWSAAYLQDEKGWCAVQLHGAVTTTTAVEWCSKQIGGDKLVFLFAKT